MMIVGNSHVFQPTASRVIELRSKVTKYFVSKCHPKCRLQRISHAAHLDTGAVLVVLGV